MVIRWQWAYPGAEVPVVGKLLLPRSGGVITPAAYTQHLHDARPDHDLLRHHAAPDRRVRQLLHPADDRRAGHGVPARSTCSRSGRSSSRRCMVLASFIVQLGTAAAGWTTYPPLSTNVGTPGLGQTLVVVAIFVTGVATIMGGVNYVTTVIRFRAPGHDVHAHAAHRLGPLAHRHPQRALRPGARLGRPPAHPRPRLRHPVLRRRRGGRQGRSRSSSSTSSGSSGTQRSTSSSSRPGASSPTSSRSSRASRPTGTRARSTR